MPNTAAAAGPAKEPHRRALMVLGHWYGQIFAGNYVVLAVSYLPQLMPTPSLPLLAAGALLAAGTIVALVAAFAGLLVHHRQLCERCVREYPLDAPAVAARRRRRLVGFHRHLLQTPILTTVACVSVWLPILGYLPGWFPLLVNGLFAPWLLYVAVCAVTHRKVQPWCPVCGSRDDDDDSETAPEPEPDGDGEPLPRPEPRLTLT